MTWIVTYSGWFSAALCVLLTVSLERRMERTRELTAQASHELRGPLTAAGLVVETLTAGGELPADRAVALDDHLRRARLALDDLVAAPGGDAAVDRLEVVSVPALVGQIALTWRPVAAARGAELRVSPVDAVVGEVLADRTRLSQAVGNLIANALE